MISIVTITFNNYEELCKTLSSVSDINCVESVVINGGTCLKTIEFLKQHKGISLSEPDRGIADAFNKGLHLSNGDAILFLNSGDVLLEREYIEWANSTLESSPEVDYIFSDFILDDSDIGHMNIIVRDFEKRSLAKGMPYPHPTLIVREKIFEKIGDFDEAFSIAMDFDMVLRMKKLNSIGHYYKKPTVLMDNNGVSSKNDFKVIQEAYKVIKKNKLLSINIMAMLMISILIFFTKSFCSFIGLKRMLKYIKRKRYEV